MHTFNETGNESSGVLADAPMTISCKFEHGRRLGIWTMARTSGVEIPTDYYPGDEFVEITGSHGVVWVNRCSGKVMDAPPLTLFRNGRLRHFEHMNLDWGDSFKAGGEQFIAALIDGSQPDMSPEFARNVYRFQLAAMRSASEHREVDLSEIG